MAWQVRGTDGRASVENPKQGRVRVFHGRFHGVSLESEFIGLQHYGRIGTVFDVFYGFFLSGDLHGHGIEVRFDFFDFRILFDDGFQDLFRGGFPDSDLGQVGIVEFQIGSLEDGVFSGFRILEREFGRFEHAFGTGSLRFPIRDHIRDIRGEFRREQPSYDLSFFDGIPDVRQIGFDDSVTIRENLTVLFGLDFPEVGRNGGFGTNVGFRMDVHDHTVDG